MANTFTKTNGQLERKITFTPKQIEGLSAAQRRIELGTANQSDVDNVNYAKSKGFSTPSGSVPIPGAQYNTRELQQANFSNIQPVGNTLYGVPNQQGSSNPNPLLPGGSPTDSPTTPTSPMDGFNILLGEALKKMQGVNADELYKRKRALERTVIGKSSEVTPEELRTFSPEQQASIRGGNINALKPDIDENAYQIQKAESSTKNFLEVFDRLSAISADYKDKMVAPDSVIENVKQMIELDYDKGLDYLKQFNQKTQEAVLGSLDFSKLSKKTDDELLTPNEAATLGVPYGTTRSQASGTIPKGSLNPQDKIDLEMKLSKQYLTNTKEARETQTQISNIETSYKSAVDKMSKGESINAASQGVLVSFQKLLDPTSVVRESEYARTGDGASLLSRLMGKYTQIVQGGAGLQAKDLKEFVDLGKQFYSNYGQQMSQYASLVLKQAENYGLNTENIIPPGDSMSGNNDPLGLGFNGVGGDTNKATAMRTDRHNNPTAFTTDIAKLAGLKEGVDYVKGDPFSGGKYYTAKLLGDPIDQTIKVIDKIGFYTDSGAQRWTHTAISRMQWNNMDYNEKKKTIAKMYQKEGGKTLKNLFA